MFFGRPRTSPSGWHGLAAAVSVFAFMGASCLAGSSFRRGGVGDSCTRTDDCYQPLRCRDQVCVDPRTGPSTATGSTTTTGNQGGAAGQGGSAVGGVGGLGGSAGSGGAGAAAGTGGAAGTAGTGAAAGSGGAGGAGGGSAAGPGVGPQDSLGVCDDCLDVLCSDQLWACDSPCVAVEACIETVCRAISDAGEEGQCQVYCQNSHPGGKTPHLGVVNCAYTGGCFPPCGIYPQDYDQCRATMTAGSCAAEWSACSASVDCLLYRDCTATCTTFASCLGCSGDSGGLAGRLLFETYENCVATECIAESWAW